MSRKNYFSGFEKLARSRGVDPYALARFAVRNNMLKKAESKAFIRSLKDIIRSRRHSLP